jgi:hypothetical protein
MLNCFVLKLFSFQFKKIALESILLKFELKFFIYSNFLHLNHRARPHTWPWRHERHNGDGRARLALSHGGGSGQAHIVLAHGVWQWALDWLGQARRSSGAQRATGRRRSFGVG